MPESSKPLKGGQRRTCRECHKPLISGMPFIDYGGTWVDEDGKWHMSLKGGTAIHVNCLLNRPNQSQFSKISELPQYLHEYEEAQRNPMTVMRDKISDLEDRLAMALKTIENLQHSQSRRNG